MNNGNYDNFQYPDDTHYMTEAQEAAYYEAANRTRELLEFADVVLMGQQVTGDDPADGVVVNIQATGTVYVEEANITIRCHRNIAGLCADCGKGNCFCRYCDSCSQLWVSPHLDEPDENGHQEEQCPECDYWLAQDAKVSP